MSASDAARARHRRLTEIFDGLSRKDAATRAVELSRLGQEAPDLAAEVGGMLAAALRDGLERAPRGEALPAIGAERGYRVLRLIGRGGMGRVYLAERVDGTFTRRVAIKVLDVGRGDDEWRQRMRVERQILARLTHPHIARLLDAGDAADGAPYLVMEFVEGVPLDAWLAAHPLDLATRVALFEKIARAVGHAHGQMVVHRDLKPANVLIDAGGEPHLLDFGIARLLSDEDRLTRDSVRLLTPRYATPEQIAGEAGGVAIDVYQLGALLYEILAGCAPFRQLSGPALLQAISQDDPAPPSRAAGDGLGKAAWARQLKGDLDAICLMALRKRPDDRYASVDALCADLERWREGEPVRASRGGTAYRLRKLARRHWLASASAALFIVVVLGFLFGLARQLERTEQERAKAQRVADLMVEVFGKADPARAQGTELTLREALDQSVERLRAANDIAPALLAQLFESLGSTYHELSAFERSESLLTEALANYRQAGEIDPQARVLQALSVVHQSQGNTPLARSEIEEALELKRAAGLLGDELESELYSFSAILDQLEGRPESAFAKFDRSLEILRKLGPGHDEQLAHVLRNLGEIRNDNGDLDGAVAPLREGWALMQKIYPTGHPDSIRMLRSLGRNAERRGDLVGALRYLEDAWQRAQAVFKPPHLVLVLTAHGLGMARLHQGELAVAAARLEDARSNVVALFPDGHSHRAIVEADLALVLALQGKDAPAEALANSALGWYARGTPRPDDAARARIVVEVLACIHAPSGERQAAAASRAVLRDSTTLREWLQPRFDQLLQRCAI